MKPPVEKHSLPLYMSKYTTHNTRKTAELRFVALDHGAYTSSQMLQNIYHHTYAINAFITAVQS